MSRSIFQIFQVNMFHRVRFTIMTRVEVSISECLKKYIKKIKKYLILKTKVKYKINYIYIYINRFEMNFYIKKNKIIYIYIYFYFILFISKQ